MEVGGSGGGASLCITHYISVTLHVTLPHDHFGDIVIPTLDLLTQENVY